MILDDTIKYSYLQIIGLNVSKTPKWAVENYDLSLLETTTKSIKEIKTDTNYIYAKGVHDDSALISFVKIGSHWHETIGSGTNFRWCLDGGNNDNENATKAVNKLKELIDKANNEVYLVVDNYPANKINSFSESDDLKTDTKALIKLKEMAGKNITNTCGYYRCLYEPSRMALGAVYIKINNQFINLAKAMLADEEASVKLNTDYLGTHKDVFKPESYDINNTTYADSFFDKAEELDDRKTIQQEIFGLNFDALKDWTVTIGDVTLFVPPTNITVISTTENQSMPILRAKGSMSKSSARVYRTLNMSIYFNEDRGINGYEKEFTAPNNQKLIYHLNGLRALISEFKFTPFLPIENKYINETLGIDAIVVTALSVSSIEGYPKTIRVDFTCREFDYLTYIPEIVDQMAPIDEYYNFFSMAFNWKTFRYYYQRPLMRGNEIAEKNYDFNSVDYNNAIFKNRTMLMPMNFLDSTVTFYIADENSLQEMLATKNEMMSMKANSINITEKEKAVMKKLSVLYNSLIDLTNTYEFQSNIEKLNTIKPSVSVDKILSGECNPSGIPNKSIIKVDLGNDSKDSLFADEDCIIISDILSSIQQEFRKANNNEAVGANFISSQTGYVSYSEKISDNEIAVYLAMHTEINIDSDTAKSISRDVSTYMNIPNDNVLSESGYHTLDITDIQTKGKPSLIIPIKCIFTKDNDNKYTLKQGSFSLDMDSPDISVLAYSKKFKDLNDKDKPSSTIEDSIKNLRFREYDAGAVRVKSYSVSMVNHIANIALKDAGSSAPQYLGGEDAMISLIIESTDENVIRTLSLLPQLSAYYMRKYHSVIPCWSVKIDSEFSRFFGIYEVMVENVQTSIQSSSMPVHTIQMDLRSVDRTYRVKESLRKIENIGNNSGRVHSKNFMNTQLKTFFQLENILAQAEIYPDLELPTIEEMKNIGYDFLRYKFQDNRVYVDPDFYFIYPNKISSQILREAIINSKESMDGVSVKFSDSTGAETELASAKKTGYSVVKQNDIAKYQSSLVAQSTDLSYASNSKQLSENIQQSKNAVSEKVIGGVQDYWIMGSDDIKPVFMEKQYKKEHQAYCDKARALGHDPDYFLSDDSHDNENLLLDTVNTNNTNTSNQTKQTTQLERDEQGQIDTSTNASDKATSIESIKEKVSFAEGKNIYQELADAREASQMIKNYLSLNYINEDVYDEVYGMEPSLDDVDEVSAKDVISMVIPLAITKNPQLFSEIHMKKIRSLITGVVDKFLSDSAITDILAKINIDCTSEKFKSTVKDIIYAIACGATGEKEYAGKKDATEWKPNADYIGVKVTDGMQANPQKDMVQSVSEGVESATSFGIFNIKQYDRNTYAKLTKENVINPWNKSDTVNTTHYLIDPYYRYNTIETIEKYKKGCITNPAFCTAAFMRICLYWLKRLIDMQAIPSIGLDIHSNSIIRELALYKLLKSSIM